MEEEKKETKPVEKVEEKKEKVEEKKVTANKPTAEGKKESKKQEDQKTTNKKATITKKDNKKTNNIAVIIAVVAIIIAIMAIVLAMTCMKESPKKVVEKALKDLKAGSYTQQMLSALLEGEDSFNEEAQKLLFEKLEWKILNENEEGDTATVELEVTNKDFKTIMGNYMQKALKLVFSSGQTLNEEEMTNYLMEELRNDEIEIVTANASIELKKQDGKWEIADEENFIYAVLPGLYEAISALN